MKLIAHEFFQDCLKRHPKAIAYALSRGITQESITQFKLGFSNLGDSLTKYILNENLDIYLAEDQNLVFRLREYQPIRDFFDNHLIFPLISDEKLISFTGRRIYNEEGDRFRHTHLRKTPKVFFNQYIIKNNTHIFVVESPINCINLCQWGYPTVAILGANSFKDKHANLFKGKQVYIIMDYDSNNSGQKATKKICGMLFKNRINPYIINMPTDIDINDFYLKYNFDDFKKLIGNKKRFNKSEYFKSWIEEHNREVQLKRKRSNTKRNNYESFKQIPITQVMSLIGSLSTDTPRVGTDFIIKCPFPDHKDTNGSFRVYTKTNTFKCYGCGKYGDAITFVRVVKHLGFKEAISYLQKTFNIGEING